MSGTLVKNTITAACVAVVSAVGGAMLAWHMSAGIETHANELAINDEFVSKTGGEQDTPHKSASDLRDQGNREGF